MKKGEKAPRNNVKTRIVKALIVAVMALVAAEVVIGVVYICQPLPETALIAKAVGIALLSVGLLMIALYYFWNISLESDKIIDTILSTNCEGYDDFHGDFADCAIAYGYSLYVPERHIDSFDLTVFKEETPFTSHYTALAHTDILDKETKGWISKCINKILASVDKSKQLNLTVLYCFQEQQDAIEAHRECRTAFNDKGLMFRAYLSFSENKLYMSRTVDSPGYATIKRLQRQLTEIMYPFIER